MGWCVDPAGCMSLKVHIRIRTVAIGKVFTFIFKIVMAVRTPFPHKSYYFF